MSNVISLNSTLCWNMRLLYIMCAFCFFLFNKVWILLYIATCQRFWLHLFMYKPPFESDPRLRLHWHKRCASGSLCVFLGFSWHQKTLRMETGRNSVERLEIVCPTNRYHASAPWAPQLLGAWRQLPESQQRGPRWVGWLVVASRGHRTG